MSDRNAKFWDVRARKYAASPIGDMEGYERTMARTRELLKPTDAVFEFGCGTGTSALKLAPSVARYVASDISPEMIKIAREKAEAEHVRNAAFNVATLEDAPWPDASFDAVLGFNILHLVPSREAALRGVRRLLKPGGLFISKTPCLKEMNFLIPLLVPVMQAVGQAPHVGLFKADDLARELEAAGFEIVAREQHGSKPKPEPRVFLVAKKH